MIPWRAPVYCELNDLFLDEACTFVLSPTQPTPVTQRKVRGVAYTQHERVTYTNAWMS